MLGTTQPWTHPPYWWLALFSVLLVGATFTDDLRTWITRKWDTHRDLKHMRARESERKAQEAWWAAVARHTDEDMDGAA